MALVAGAVGAGFKEPLVHASGNGAQAPYRYRRGLGMVPCAEFDVYHDDFNTLVTANVPTGWTAAIIDVGTTVTAVTTTLGTTGAIAIFDANVSEGASIYLPKAQMLTVGKRWFMEARIQCDDMADSEFQFGLSDLTATTNPEDLWTTTAANLVSFGILSGSALTKMLSDKANSGTVVQSGTISLLNNTWHKLAIGYDGVQLTGWVDGQLSLTWSGAAATIPTGTSLAPFIGARNGTGTGGAIQVIDYVRFVSER